MVIQIFGTLKCRDTNKAIRFFKERKIQIQFVDLSQKEISPGELNNIKKYIPLENLIDTEGKEYKKMNLAYIIHDIEEMLLAHPLLFKTPVVRAKAMASIGYEPDTWKDMISALP